MLVNVPNLQVQPVCNRENLEVITESLSSSYTRVADFILDLLENNSLFIPKRTQTWEWGTSSQVSFSWASDYEYYLSVFSK